MLLHEGTNTSTGDAQYRNLPGRYPAERQRRGFVTASHHRFELLGIESEYDLMNSGLPIRREMNKAWTGEDVKGSPRCCPTS